MKPYQQKHNYRAQCSELMPCRAGITWGGKPFKLSFCIQSCALEEGAEVSASSKPFVTVNTVSKQKQTELGDWHQEDGRWWFRETLTMEVTPDEEVCISVSCNQQVDLLVAALSLASKCVGEVCVPVASVLPQLQVEDRDVEGMIYATPNIGFDVLKEGVKTGRAYLSFETKNPPAKQSLGGESWCALNN
ncbi:hypothetical protein AK812_SmicGene26981 [Symbiodinium microadriaticum]|uniref:C2 domain-containing protein n=1 Tax=Symbiodinium microadriaticum TaxID=2951 RepID=A0A1Q9D828_SYMMI|nr:hypothetical protein AK812_SmicGene26981 [Symbiodinium microadriaticum]